MRRREKKRRGERGEREREMRGEMTSRQAHARAGALATRSKLHGPL